MTHERLNRDLYFQKVVGLQSDHMTMAAMEMSHLFSV